MEWNKFKSWTDVQCLRSQTQMMKRWENGPIYSQPRTVVLDGIDVVRTE